MSEQEQKELCHQCGNKYANINEICDDCYDEQFCDQYEEA